MAGGRLRFVLVHRHPADVLGPGTPTPAPTSLSGLPFWLPLTVAAAMVPDSSESSPRYSGVRPAGGVRLEETPGPRMTFLPERKASSAWATPLS